MYDLYVDGLRDLARSQLFRRIRRVREGMVGLTDGVNRVFRTVYAPLFSAATTQIYSSGSLLSSGSYSLDVEAGYIELVTPLTAGLQPQATYEQVDLTTTQQKDLLFRAVEEMELRWPRGYRRSSTSATYTAATGDEDHVYVMDGTLVADPVVGSTTFGSSLVQHAFLIGCVEYLLLLTQAQYAAPNEFSFREDRGVAIDRKGIPAAIEAALSRQEKRLAYLVRQAQEESYGLAGLGGYLSHPQSTDNQENYDWLTAARESS
jgi:hypothetical protein